MKKFVVLDGSSLMYRAFYALPMLTSESGEYTGAIFGFANMLFKICADLSPDALVIAFDKSKKTFRGDMYAEYKATREKTPPELSSQIPLLKEFVAALGITLIEKENYEADDIIGTLAKKAPADHEVTIVTGDRDALQLIDENTKVLFTKKGVRDIKKYDEQAFAEEYGGLKPLQLVDLKGLMGDSSDNIPGVFGIGQKTAVKIIAEYGSVENALDHADEIKSKSVREKLAAGRENALLSKRLAAIYRDVPDVEFFPEEYAVKPDRQAVRAFCERYGLKNVLKNFEKTFPASNEATLFADGDEKAAATPHEETYETLTGDALPKDIANADEIALVPLLAGKQPFPALLGLAVCVGGKVYFAENAAAPEAFAGKTVYVFGAKELYHVGFKEQRNFFDAKIAAYLIDPAAAKYEIAALATNLLGEDVPTAFASPKDEVCFAARQLIKLGRHLKNALAEKKLADLYEKTEKPLSAILAEMEETGIYVSREHLAEKSKEAAQRIEKLADDIWLLAGEKFNINSSKQLPEILFGKMGIEPIKKTKTGYSTDAEVLSLLKEKHPIAGVILEYRFWTKLKSTYLDGIGDLINERTGRVHTSFHQTVTATGRLSSSDPNLQNIPVRTEEGQKIRSFFEPQPPYDAILSADYSQIELRVLAHMSGDKNFIAAFHHAEDIHAHTAAEVFGVAPDRVTPDLRRRAKEINFGIIYGMSDFGLAKKLGVSRKEAANYIAMYFGRYPDVKKFMEETIENARRDGFVATMFGRKREIPALKSDNFNRRTEAERMAMNTPIQGTAADIIKIAMTTVHRRLKEAQTKSRLLLQVHDELVLETVSGETEQITAILKDAMENAAKLAVPLTANISVGKNWAEAH